MAKIEVTEYVSWDVWRQIGGMIAKITISDYCIGRCPSIHVEGVNIKDVIEQLVVRDYVSGLEASLIAEHIAYTVITRLRRKKFDLLDARFFYRRDPRYGLVFSLAVLTVIRYHCDIYYLLDQLKKL